jgi:hypothetical protein
MDRSIWIYPWDVQDLGLPLVEAELRQNGLNMLSLASSYHAGRFLQPRSPHRKAYFPEDGTIYFHPSPRHWQGVRLQPQPAGILQQGDVLADLLRRREAGGLAVSCWTVCLHNSRLGLAHPDVVTRNAWGDPSWHSLCPSHPDARAYVRALVADLSHGYRPDRIELETPGFMGFAHGHHHEKDAVGLLPEEDFLMSLCFCTTCSARAAAAGVDIAPAQELVRFWLEGTFARATPEPRFPDFPAGGIETFLPWPELHAFLAWRSEPVTSLVAELREICHPETRLVVIDLAEGWLGGSDLPALARACDGLILCAYAMEAEAVAPLLRRGREMAGARFLGAGFRLFYPEIASPEALFARVEPALALADGVNFYNYGLIPAPRLTWIGAALQPAGDPPAR